MKTLIAAAAAALLLAACDTAPVPAPAAEAPASTVEVIQETPVEVTPNLFILYTLKDGVTPAQFEEWVRTTDQPAMRSLARVQSFRTYRAERLLMGEGAPGVAYIEAFAIPDLEGFTAEDMGGETVQTVMGEFMGLVEAPQFIIVSEVK
ncbi:REDY-like protein HapK [Hyphomonas sp.]|uniref:REDY-like protein HapK n=1 Tax=Hyphomonas sp. TaxID=87 RepID=UPI0025BDD798|nr:REDY-like protein HapK [Hyphomonas sp.]